MGINNGRIRSFEMAWHYFGEEKKLNKRKENNSLM
jgi:hypothetical protein